MSVAASIKVAEKVAWAFRINTSESLLRVVKKSRAKGADRLGPKGMGSGWLSRTMAIADVASSAYKVKSGLSGGINGTG